MNQASSTNPCKPRKSKPWRAAVRAWLSDLAGSLGKTGESEADQMLVDTGLYDLMKGGKVIERDLP